MAISGELETKFNEILSEYRGEKPGVALALIKDGRILHRACHGLADIEKGIPVNPLTNFRLASVSKQFTAMCIMILTEKGKLSYDDSLRDILPEFPAYADGITVKNMLQHTSGLRSYDEITPRSFRGQLRDGDVLQMHMDQEATLFEPGTRYQYSNDAYVLLGIMVERISGVSFTEFIDCEIFRKLGMKTSVLHDEGVTTIEDRAYGYSVNERNIKFNDQSKASLLRGDGGVYSNLEDMYLWDQALYTGSLVSQDAMRDALTRGSLTGGEETFYGYGWYLETFYGYKVMYHGGSTAGFRNFYFRVPETSLSLMLFTNRDRIDLNFGVEVADFRTGIDLMLADLLPYIEV
jgi:CubicO group peptidase (beta-lactamase class C family)